VLGFYGVFIGLRYKTSQDLIQRIDADDYAEAETFTIKVPIALPYQEDQDTFERVNGEIEYQGNVYRLVKQKLSHDTLYIVCLSDAQAKHINNAMHDYVKTFADKTADSKQNIKAFSFIKDYLPTKIILTPGIAGWSHPLSMNSLSKDLMLNSYISIQSPPPKA
jgi:hypothetical protein